jgi:hypothetical protein
LELPPAPGPAFKESPKFHFLLGAKGCGAGVSTPPPFFPEPLIISRSLSVDDALGDVSTAEFSNLCCTLLENDDGDLQRKVKRYP